jgi:hypothetical protein
VQIGKEAKAAAGTDMGPDPQIRASFDAEGIVTLTRSATHDAEGVVFRYRSEGMT